MAVRRSARRRGAMLLGVAGLFTVVPSAAAVPFGANLARPANNTVPCAINPGLGIPWLGVTPPQSCTWINVGSLASTAESFNVPAGRGRLTQARVKVGPVTGPMQISVFRAYRAPFSTALPVCCIVRFSSEAFTPAPNSVTTVRLPNVEVVNDRVPEPGSDALRFDAVALSVLAPGVPIPAHATGNIADGALGFYPSMQVGQERYEGGAGIGGFVPLLNVEWVPVADDGSGAENRILGLPRSAFQVRANQAVVDLLCRLGAPCRGVARLQSRRAAGAGQLATRPATVTYGVRSFTVEAGKRGRVAVTLNARGKRFVRGAKARRVWLNVQIPGRGVFSRQVTLRR